MFYKKHPIATVITLALVLNGLRCLAYYMGRALALVALMYIAATDPGSLVLALIAIAAFLAGFITLFTPVLPPFSSRRR